MTGSIPEVQGFKWSIGIFSRNRDSEKPFVTAVTKLLPLISKVGN
jgi:hypothetical protein